MNLYRLRSSARFAAKFIGRLGLAAVHLLAAAVIAWYVLRLYPGDRWTPVRLGSYFAPWLFMALIPGLFIALVGRRRWLARVIIVLIAVFVGFYGPALIPRQPEVYADSNANQLRVMTFNVNFSNTNVQGIADLIHGESPDVIAFQELGDNLASGLRPKLTAEYPYYLVDRSWALPMALMSRYPLTAQPKPPGADRAQHATVKTTAGPVVIWNVHPNPALTGGWQSQRELLMLVAGEIAQEERPLIVLGDFNTTDQTANYRLMADRLTNVQRSVGQGFGFTYPDFKRALQTDQPWYTHLLVRLTRPVVGIDHIFISHHFIPQEVHVAPTSGGSDHRPVTATLQIDE